MVKLPLRVITRHPSQRDQLLAGGHHPPRRPGEARGGGSSGDRRVSAPILLVQAERVDACEPLRERLAADFGIPKDQIRISVGVLDELPGPDEIKSPKCPVRIIITVQKLREGWGLPVCLRAVQRQRDALGHGH